MTTIRTPYLVSHTKSTNLWFRRTIPVGWRQLAGRREIHFSLQTANKREAARRCRLVSAVVQIIFDEAERWLERGAPEVNAFAIKLRAAIDLRVNELKQAYAPKALKAHETNLNEGDTIDVQIARLGLSDALTHEGGLPRDLANRAKQIVLLRRALCVTMKRTDLNLIS